VVVLVVTGLEASRTPYSKSHARRLKRREKEELTAGGLGSLKAALPSIAPTTRTTAATIIGDSSSAGELDAAATTTTATATATAAASMKPINNKLKSKSKSTKQPTDQSEVPPPSPTTRPGQIGEGHGAPLMRSQRRRRALYATYFLFSLPTVILRFAIDRKAAHPFLKKI
jgi:ribosome biogenesis protein SLX9